MGWLDGILERLERYNKGLSQTEEVVVPVERELEVRTSSSSDDHVFDRAVEFVLKEEGGYVNDPNDPGGETNFGISKRSYPKVDIKNLTRETAKSIYYKDYFLPISPLAKDSPEVAIAVFDTAVNMGVGTAIRLLQRALGVSEDGVIGPVTLATLRKKKDSALVRFLFERLTRYQALGTWAIYRKGWTMRVLRLAMEVA